VAFAIDGQRPGREASPVGKQARLQSRFLRRCQWKRPQPAGQGAAVDARQRLDFLVRQALFPAQAFGV